MATPTGPPLQLDIQGEIAVIYLNRADKLNALTGDLYRELAFMLRNIAKMDKILVTVLTGRGRYFSAGADVQGTGMANAGGNTPLESRTFWLRSFAANNLELTKAFLSHPKILVAALNGPAVGLSAALLGCCDFIYMVENAFILTPFTSLALVAEGGASETFVRRMGLSKANEALILSKRIPASELLACGFANKLYPKPTSDTEFHKQVLGDIREQFCNPGLNQESMLLIKGLIRSQFEAKVESANVQEVFGGLERFLGGYPQREFARVASGEKKHKL